MDAMTLTGSVVGSGLPTSPAMDMPSQTMSCCFAVSAWEADVDAAKPGDPSNRARKEDTPTGRAVPAITNMCEGDANGASNDARDSQGPPSDEDSTKITPPDSGAGERVTVRNEDSFRKIDP